jgi:hypothetical protein
MLEFLRITNVDGTKRYIPSGSVVHVTTATDALDAGSDYRAPNVTRGVITSVGYLDGSHGAGQAVVLVNGIAAFNGANIRYEYGAMTFDGAFSAALSN